MRIETETKLDFKDVLIRPKRSTLSSRADVDITRSFTYRNSGLSWTGVPIIASNMDSIGTLPMARALARQGAMTALHKFHAPEDLAQFLTEDPAEGSASPLWPQVWISLGSSPREMEALEGLIQRLSTLGGAEAVGRLQLCLDVANGYQESFVDFTSRLRQRLPRAPIMAGNVVTGEMVEELLLAGADIVKVGIGGGSVCTTRRQTGVGYPQLSAVIECADAAHGLGGLICSDGGCTVPGDLAKAFGGGADFIMLGGMLAGHEECGGAIQDDDRLFAPDDPDLAAALKALRPEQRQRLEQILPRGRRMLFYGMSSETAMTRHYGGVAGYRAAEGKTVSVPFRGPVEATVSEILGGLRSACTYVGARRLKELSKRTTFILSTIQTNDIFGRS